MAKNRGLRIDELLEEMETIVASGTKLNVDYAIDEMVDEYEQDEILEYFKSCETSSLQVAQEELADSNFNWEQLKLMRIKFLCVYGNWVVNGQWWIVNGQYFLGKFMVDGS